MISGIFYAVITWYFDLLDRFFVWLSQKVLRLVRRNYEESSEGQA